MSISPKKAVPPLGSSRPVSIDIVVVLPAPLWPRRANICPLNISSERSLTAYFPPGYTLESPLTLKD